MVSSPTSVDTMLQALADPTRRSVVELLAQRPYRASDLAEATGVTRSRMSKHLHVLLDAGITEDERPVEDARSRVFRLKPQALDCVSAWVGQLRQEWDAQLQSFKQYAEGQEGK